MKSEIGVIGGMGPLASAAFVRSLYALYQGQVEQALPAVRLYSDPSMGDRTTVLLGGGDPAPLLRKLESDIRRLVDEKVQRIVICCVTVHHLLPRLAPELRRHVTSLIDLAIQELGRARKRCLIACSTGTNKLRIFQRHAEWEQVAPWAVFPSDEEQELLHESIYRLKRYHVTQPLIEVLARIAANHRVEAILAGCTELHLLSPLYAGCSELNQTYEFLDPLSAAARLLMEEEGHAPEVCS